MGVRKTARVLGRQARKEMEKTERLGFHEFKEMDSAEDTEGSGTRCY